jgi:beta-phosphoglucomutase-like phosphatase (HAD superfamily)
MDGVIVDTEPYIVMLQTIWWVEYYYGRNVYRLLPVFYSKYVSEIERGFVIEQEVERFEIQDEAAHENA